MQYIGDRRRVVWFPSFLTIGLIVVSLGLYAYVPENAIFYHQLAAFNVERLWGNLLILVGGLLAFSSFSRNRLVRWTANTSCSLVCGWSFILALQSGSMPPSAMVCGIVALGTLADMTREAFDGVRIRKELGNGCLN